MIGQQDDLLGRLDHGPFRLDLLEPRVGQPARDRHAVNGQEGLVDVEAAQGGGRELPARAVGGRPDHAAGHDHGRPRIADQLEGIGDRRGDDHQVLPGVKRPGQAQRRRPRVEDDRAAVGDELHRTATDRQLLLLVLAETERGVGLIARPEGDRSPVSPPDQSLLGQPGKVAPDGLVGHAKDLDQVSTPDAPSFADQVGDDPEAVLREQVLAQTPHSRAVRRRIYHIRPHLILT